MASAKFLDLRTGPPGAEVIRRFEFSDVYVCVRHKNTIETTILLVNSFPRQTGYAALPFPPVNIPSLRSRTNPFAGADFRDLLQPAQEEINPFFKLGALEVLNLIVWRSWDFDLALGRVLAVLERLI